MRIFKFIILFFFFNVSAQIEVRNVLCDATKNPLAVATSTPRFGWQLFDVVEKSSQKAYHILVASSIENLKANIGDIWDSKKVKSNQSQWITYKGKPLENETKYFWKVRVWNHKNKKSAWSTNAFFRLAPLTKNLNPTWIGAITKANSHLPEGRKYHTASFKKSKRLAIVNASDSLARRSILLRKEFTVAKKLKEAVVYISGLGHYELSINGKKIGNSEFAPLWSDYDKTVNYNTYELSEKDLKQGNNAIGVSLGNGMYNMVAERYAKFFVSFGPPTLFFKMKLKYADGTEEIVQSDKSWKYNKSPITYNSIFGGEDYDANLEITNWKQPNFKALEWKPVIQQEEPKGRLMAQITTPVVIKKQYTVKEYKELKPNTYVFNMGQNLAGFPTLKVQGKKGQSVRLWVAESLKDDGSIRQGRSGKPYYFQYTLKGDGIETWTPKFSFYGYQYIQAENVNYIKNSNANLPTILALTSNFIYNDAGETGSFSCSNEIFNKAHELINNAIKSNFQAVLTDCPHREKLGWLEEAHLNGPGLLFNYNMKTYFPSIMQNIADAQRKNGMVPTIAPEYVVFGGDFTDSPEWGVSAVILPWMYYEYYGDASLIEKYYPVMKRYVDYLSTTATDNIVSHGLGDWYDYGEHAAGYSKNSPIALSATSHYYYGVHLLAKAAELLEKKEDATFYKNLSITVKNAFNATFFNEDTKQYATASQFSNAVALFMNLVAPENKQAVLQNLVNDIKNRGYRLTTGDVGNRYLFQALAQNDKNEVMHKMNNHTDAPGYGFQIKFGLTTLTEQWDPRKGNSWNHFMMGQIEEWFYQSLAGIQADPEQPGFKHFFIKPALVGDMSFVKAEYKSIYGTIQSEWKKQDGMAVFNITVPVNTTSTVVLPVDKNASITINGKSLAKLKRKLKVDTNANQPTFTLGSGTYNITTKK